MAYPLHIKCDQCGRGLNSMSGERLVIGRWNTQEDRDVMVCSDDCAAAATADTRWRNAAGRTNLTNGVQNA